MNIIIAAFLGLTILMVGIIGAGIIIIGAGIIERQREQRTKASRHINCDRNTTYLSPISSRRIDRAITFED